MEGTPKAIAFDLDGTLAESKQPLTPEMGALISRLLEKMPVAIMSGDSFPHFKEKLLERLSSTTILDQFYLFPTNAGQCYTYKNGTWESQYDHRFSDDEKTTILAALNEALVEVGLGDIPPQVWGERIEDRGSQIAFSPLGQQAPVAAKELWRTEHDTLRRKLRDILAARLPDFSIVVGGMTTIDILHKGITKAYGVRQFSELIGRPISDLLYVGDALEEGGNDAVVIETGVPTHKVKDPEETASLIEALIV